MTALGYLKRQEFYTEKGGIGVELMPLLHSAEVEKFTIKYYNKNNSLSNEDN